jgi:hypothetical protein
MNFKLTYIVILFSANSIFRQDKNAEQTALQIVNIRMEFYNQHNFK